MSGVSEVSDTHKRAMLRGREAVARMRLKGGVWATRLYATLGGVTTLLAIFGPGGPHWVPAIVMAVWASALLIASNRIERGSRVDACILFGLFLLGSLGNFLTVGNINWFTGAVSAVVLLVLGNAVIGTFELAKIRKEEALIAYPPAPGPPR